MRLILGTQLARRLFSPWPQPTGGVLSYLTEKPSDTQFPRLRHSCVLFFILVPDLASLYDLHAGAVYAFALNLLRDEGEAKDILHTVFVRLARSPGGPPARSGLLKLTHWLVLDRLRQQKSSASRETRWNSESQPLFTPSADPDTALFDDALAAALLILPVDQRAVVHLHLWENTSFDAIGGMLGISRNTAASRYRLALVKLQDHLRPLYNEIR